MNKPFTVTLAATVDPLKNPDVFDEIQFPCSLSPKFDGIRGHVKDGEILSRKNILLPNTYTQSKFKDLEGLDGELIVGCETDHDVYNRTQSGIMTIAGAPDVTFWLMDTTFPQLKAESFTKRFNFVETYVKNLGREDVKVIPHELVHNIEELIDAEAKFLAMGFEGICGRRPDGEYKYGRSTLKQGLLWKLKRFEDFEAVIEDVEEGSTNNNEATIDNLGHTKRSSHQENKTPSGRVGTFLVKYKGQIERIAPGAFSHAQLAIILKNKEKYKGTILKCRHFPHGAKDKVRHGRAVGFRSEIDL